MATYAESGVNIEEGDRSSELAYSAAKQTFSAREGMFGNAVLLEGGFTGLIDMGDFYLVQNNDGVGSKTEIARKIKKYDTLGYDLLAMVADDAVCVGAEVISISNTIDTDKVDSKEIGAMMEGLKKACLEQKIIIPGGEIAEMGRLLNCVTWNSTCVGVLEKTKFIDGKKVKPGQKIIGLKSRGFRSNGFSLVRHVLENTFGTDWHGVKFDDNQSWGEIVLTPSLIYHDFVLELLGRFKQERKFEISGVVHVTGGGIGNNMKRILKANKLGAKINSLPEPHAAMLKLQELGNVADKEAYKTWNMGIGMMLIIDESLEQQIISEAEKKGFKALSIGEITKNEGVDLISKGFHNKGEKLDF